MGKIRGLEKFCIQSDNISQKIGIRDEIAKWRRENGKDPTIIIDVKELNRFLGAEHSENSLASALQLGGQFWKFHEILEFFFGEMKKANANLVFIVRLDEGRYKDLNKWKKSTLHPQERLLYNLMDICSKYGEVSMNYGLGKRSILSYARQNRDTVMALITRNAPYLVYDIDFSYWSLSHVDFYKLSIVKICQKQMLRELELSTNQMKIILAISLLPYNVKFRLIGKGCNKFVRVVEYVKPLRYGKNGFDLNELTRVLSQDQRNNLDDELNHVFAVNNYTGNVNADIFDGLILDLIKTDESFKSMLQFYKENIYFAYKLINEKDSSQKDLLCIKDRQHEDVVFKKLVINMMLKMCGVLFKDVDPKKRPKTRTIHVNQNGDDIYIATEMAIIYPTMALQSLQELLIEEENKRFDNSRWSILCWLLGLDAGSVHGIRYSNYSKFIRVVSLTLQFLQTHKLISAREADIILQIEMDQDKKLPRSSSDPPTKLDQTLTQINGTWAQIAHKYTIAYKLICHCLEVSGLRMETALIMFDGLEFNVRMEKMENYPNPKLMTQMQRFGL